MVSCETFRFSCRYRVNEKLYILRISSKAPTVFNLYYEKFLPTKRLCAQEKTNILFVSFSFQYKQFEKLSILSDKPAPLIFWYCKFQYGPIRWLHIRTEPPLICYSFKYCRKKNIADINAENRTSTVCMQFVFLRTVYHRKG